VNLKERLIASGEALLHRGGTVQVLVDLNVREPDAACLQKLAAYGLEVSEVIGNKLVGTIPGEQIGRLERDPQVAEVEVATRLKPTARL